MEQLDLVYNTFSNLEKNYARSKKTRTEYVMDKFGGNIQIGSFLILNALSGEEFSDAEDIRKFSEVRKIFTFLLDNADRLDALRSFNPREDTATDDVYTVLDAAQVRGTGISVIAQEDLMNEYRGAYHYVVSRDKVRMVSLDAADKCHIFSKAMAALFTPLCNEVVKVGDVLQKSNVGQRYTVIKD